MRIYTVQSGDSVFKIARELGTTPARIIVDNQIDNPARLTVGESLVISEPTEEYTVVAGDTLEGIAARFGTTVMSLWQNNPSLGGGDKIYVGQRLIIRQNCPKRRTVTVNGYAYPYIDKETLRATLPYLTDLSVFSYGIRPDGTLIPPEGDERGVVTTAREYGVRPILVLTSLTEDGTFSDQLAAGILRNRELWPTVGSELLRYAREKGYRGFEVDFEYIPGELARDYADFVSYLREISEAEQYTVTVAVAPKTSRDQPGILYESHDYRLLGEAADSVLAMTYEWGYTYGPPMAVSPLPEVKRVLDFAVTEIPPEKLLLGLPNYGYDWPLPYERGKTKAATLSNTEARRLAVEKKAAIRYDEISQAPTFSYFAKDGTAPAVEHRVWFDDARSMMAKLSLVEEYSLSGVGIWNVMRFFPALWEILNCLYDIRKY